MTTGAALDSTIVSTAPPEQVRGEREPEPVR